jgi:hypothetical protein
MKLWTTSDEWKKYASCGGSIDHTIPPERDEEDADKPVANVRKVQHICGTCRVRPECVRWALKPGADQPVDVWVAGRFIPVNKRKARRVRQELAETLDREYAARGDDV